MKNRNQHQKEKQAAKFEEEDQKEEKKHLKNRNIITLLVHYVMTSIKSSPYKFRFH